MDREENTLIGILCGVEKDRLDLFDCKAMSDMLIFKWDKYAKMLHTVGFIMHMIYIVVFSVFVHARYTYLEYGQETKYEGFYLVSMSITLLYPLAYDMTQLRK